MSRKRKKTKRTSEWDLKTSEERREWFVKTYNVVHEPAVIKKALETHPVILYRDEKLTLRPMITIELES